MAILMKRAQRRGFTLIEMLVVLAIIVVISAIVFSGESNFNRSFYLTNTAYDIALSIRQTQAYGISSAASSGVLNAGYGVSLTTAAGTGYNVFTDLFPTTAAKYGSASTPASRPGNSVYDSGELVSRYGLTSGVTISKICDFQAGGFGYVCYNTPTNPPHQIDILFSRPNNDTTITDSWSGFKSAESNVCFVVSDSVGDNRYIAISSVGQVAVVTSCP